MPEDSLDPQLIRERFPFPISHAFTMLEGRIEADACYDALLTCFEVTLKTLASISLANFMRDVQEDPAFGNARLFQDLLGTLSRPLSLGNWQQMLQLTLRPYATNRERLMVPRLFDFHFRVTEQGAVRAQSAHLQPLQHFIEERNEDAHHRNRSHSGSRQRQAALAGLTLDLKALLARLKFPERLPADVRGERRVPR
jgi:hypothetical protein